MKISEEYGIKLERIGKYLEKHGADAVVLQRSDNFAWATCGGSDHVNTATDFGVATLIADGAGCTLVTNKIEAGRLRDEEISGLPIEITALDWANSRDAFIHNKLAGKKALADFALTGASSLSDDFIDLQLPLTESEVERYKKVGADTAAALEAASMSLKRGMTEYDAAARLSSECYERGVTPIVVLIAADDRLHKYRHPLPTQNRIDKTVMIVVCGRQKGLIASATRIVSFGMPDDDLLLRHDACARIDTVFNKITRPGKSIADIFRAATDCYRLAGFDGEWLLHHQGGPTGYRTRYYTANENTTGAVAPNSAFAWNPSITGTKTEDTIIVGEDENIFITHTGNWTYIDVQMDGKIYKRPAILTI